MKSDISVIQTEVTISQQSGVVSETKQQRREDFRRSIQAAARRKENEKKKSQQTVYKATNKKKRQTQKLPTILEHQMGMETLCGITKVIPEMINEYGSHIENVTAMFVALSDCTTWRQATSIVFLYFKTFSSQFVTDILLQNAIQLIFPATLDSQSSEGDDGFPMWISVVKCVTTNWQSIVGSTFFRKIVQLISISCALGLCTISKIPFGEHALHVFPSVMETKFSNVTDLFSACGETLIYFIEGGYRCFQLGDLTPFTFSEDAASSLEREFFDLCELAPLMRAGNMERIKNVSENDFDYRINKAVNQCETLHRAAIGMYERRQFAERLAQLRKIRTDFMTIRADGGLRQRPFAFYVYGPSGVGKSTVSAVLMRIILMANGYDASDDRIVNLNEADAYMSNYRSYVNGVYCDDMGNTQAKYLEKSPMTKVIDLINNVKAYAVMAELELKGKVTIEPKCVGASSNLALAGLAHQFSNEPFSIVSRFNIQVECRVKEEFACADGRLDQNKVFEVFGDELPVVPDLWDLRVYEPSAVGDNHMRYELGKQWTLPMLVKYVVKKSVVHFANQRKFIHVTENLDAKLQMCSVCKLPKQLCTCSQENGVMMDHQFGSVHIPRAAVQQGLNYAGGCRHYLYNCAASVINRSQVIHSQVMSSVARLIMLKAMYGKRVYILCVGIAIMLHYLFLIYDQWLLLGTLFGIVFYVCCSIYYEYVNLQIRRSMFVPGSLNAVFNMARSHHISYIGGMSAMLIVCYHIYKTYRRSERFTEVLAQQGSLNPKSAEDIEKRDAEKSEWVVPPVQPLHGSIIAKTTPMDVFADIVARNSVYVEHVGADVKHHTKGIFVRSNFLMLPLHYVRHLGKEFKLRIVRNSGGNGTTFVTPLSDCYWHELEDCDIAICFVPNSPSYRDIIAYFPEHQYRSCEAVLVHRMSDGVIKQDYTYATQGVVPVPRKEYQGYVYELQTETFKGLCGAALCSHSKESHILGLHIGGKHHIGGSVYVAGSQIRNAIVSLSSVRGVVVTAAQGTILSQQYGVKYYESSELHYKSPCRFLPPEVHCDIFGSVNGRVSYESKVEPTVISGSVESVCGVPNQWGPPKFGPQRWKPWQESLQYSAKPAIGFEGHLMKRALDDYVEPLKAIIQNGDIFPQRPLTNDEVVCGIPGVRFIDALKASTSVGYPLTGPKSAFLYPAEDPEGVYQDYVKLDDRFWKEFDIMCTKYARGERAYPIFKATLKDEPTLIIKDKVRVFQAAPLVLQLGVRKYFLPVARVLSLYPLISECAVGVNAHGPEWEELALHMRKFGEKRIFAGDYGKYDLRLPMQVTLAAFDVLLELASCMEYSEEDLVTMRGLISDIVAPLIAFNGDLIMLFGSNPSGQNMTVFINSVGNSLILRCAFYGIYDSLWFSRDTNFRRNVAIMTYGDDVKGSVRETHGFFNHVAVAEWLSQRDIVFTMPDKTSKPIPFMKDSDADFLKRHNVFVPELGHFVGQLDEKSIFKSLHSVLRSKAVTNREQCISNIRGALDEWFFYGKQHYEKRRKEMERVACEHNLCVEGLSYSFEKKRQLYLDKYYPEMDSN